MTSTSPEGTEILLVEDSPEDATLTMRALSRHDLARRVRLSKDGAEALEYLRDAPRPKVALLDLQLPKVSGLRVLAAIRDNPRLRTLPVIVLTSSREAPDIAQAYALGANSYIVKPVDFDQFAYVVSQVGLYWLSLNQPPPA